MSFPLTALSDIEGFMFFALSTFAIGFAASIAEQGKSSPQYGAIPKQAEQFGTDPSLGWG